MPTAIYSPVHAALLEVLDESQKQLGEDRSRAGEIQMRAEQLANLLERCLQAPTRHENVRYSADSTTPVQTGRATARVPLIRMSVGHPTAQAKVSVAVEPDMPLAETYTMTVQVDSAEPVKVAWFRQQGSGWVVDVADQPAQQITAEILAKAIRGRRRIK